jgi:predicted lipoprotein with Yx(FWY)xxD motif
MSLHIGTRARAALAVASIALAAACGSGSGGTTTSTHQTSGIVGTARNATLGSTVLVNHQGRTLYTLSAERNGHFICTATEKIPGSSQMCLQLWKPLLVKGAVKAAGIGSLGTVMRPDGGGRQLTYKGRPLYTFADDHAAGDAAGNGFKDVGTWQAATVGAAAASTPATTSSGGGGYGY